jgi:uncharacterized protein (TIGR04255 family)
MVKRGTPLPKKLKCDAIVEALLELRFDGKDDLPEVFIGRFVDHRNWKGWVQRTLPAYNIPAQFRSVVPNVKFAPIIELVENESKAVLRIGPSVVSFHRQAPYVGWEKFKPELERVTAALFETIKDVLVTRLGLRYMNSLRPNLHGIAALTDLDVEMTVSGDAISKAANLNFTTQLGKESACAVRIATPEFILGNLPADTSVYVDVDVFTNEGFKTADNKTVDEWVEFAHTQEKTEFFRLFKQPVLDKLREE